MATVRYTSIDGRVIAEKRGAARKVLVPDAIGSTIALTGTNETLTDEFTYWPYGSDLPGSSQVTSLRYAGTLGYHGRPAFTSYVRARLLRHDLGRWLTPDPLPDQILAPYRYAFSNPSTWVDPTGLMHCIFNAPGAVGVLNCYAHAGECFAPVGAGPPYCPGRGVRVLTCTAGNRVTNPAGDPRVPESHGPIPTGNWAVGDPNEHPGDETGPYGPWFIPVLVPANVRTGIGIHGGRRGPRSQTHGCIRLSNTCLLALVRWLRSRFVQRGTADPGVTLTVQEPGR